MCTTVIQPWRSFGVACIWNYGRDGSRRSTHGRRRMQACVYSHTDNYIHTHTCLHTERLAQTLRRLGYIHILAHSQLICFSRRAISAAYPRGLVFRHSVSLAVEQPFLQSAEKAARKPIPVSVNKNTPFTGAFPLQSSSRNCYPAPDLVLLK